MKNFKTIILLFLLLGIKEIKAQLPLGDATFSLTQTDNFNSSTLSSQWITLLPWGEPTGAGAYFSSSNVILTYSSGYLALKTATTTPITYTPSPNSPYNYTGGVISSTYTCKYGYYEISAKNPIARGIAAAFWLFGGATSTACPGNGGTGWYDEIDIMESQGDMSANNYETGCVHHWRDQGDCNRYYNWDDLTITGLPDLSQEHKYAVFWEPDWITWYIDDKPVLTKYDPVYTPHHPMSIIIDSDIEARTYFPYGPVSSASLPAYMLINYINVYQLIPDCGTSVSFCGNFNPLSYTSKVKQSISIGGSGCSDNINTGDNIHLWATDYILLDEGTTITDNGSGSFQAKITMCPN